MRKAFLAVSILSLALAMPAFGQGYRNSASARSYAGVKGKMFLGGHAGYTVGFGDAFWNEEETYGGITYESSFKPGINLGATFHYGVSERFMVGGELSMQKYTAKETLGDSEDSESFSKGSILFSGLYALSYVEGGNSLFLTFGPGLRQFPGYRLGLYGGIAYHAMVSEMVGLCVMPKCHYILAEEGNPLMISLSVGVTIPLGR